MAEGDITLDAPPEVPKALPANPLARLLPVAMLVAAGGMMALYFTSGVASTTRGPMFMFFPVMMLASVLGSLAYGTRGANHTAQLNEDRRDYLGYLDALDQSTCQDRRRPASLPALDSSRPGCVVEALPVAGACGSAEATILTSAISESAAVTSRSAPRS